MVTPVGSDFSGGTKKRREDRYIERERKSV